MRLPGCQIELGEDAQQQLVGGPLVVGGDMVPDVPQILLGTRVKR